jgi:hypothetical protein
LKNVPAVLLISVFLAGYLYSSEVTAKKLHQFNQSSPGHQKIPKSTSIDNEQDEFGSSAQQDTALGPKIKYPKAPFKTYSSSQRFFTGGQVNSLPISSPAEALEIVPGLAVGH